MKLYEDTYKNKDHFSFGKNWKKFLKGLNKEKIEESKRNLSDFLGLDNLKNKTFVDLGCGSGLSSLSAILLEAKKVVSVDIDENSIHCTEFLKKKFKISDNRWEIKKISALEKSKMEKLGKFDIVYSWGVLHHTGNMFKAFENANLLVKKKGLLYLAIYNKNDKRILEGTSKFWLKAKKIYNQNNNFVKKTMYYAYLNYLLLGIAATGRNPFNYIKNYKTYRGMDFYRDIEDWLGGYPYEFASGREMNNYFKKLDYKVVRQNIVRSIGCNEFLYLKK